MAAMLQLQAEKGWNKSDVLPGSKMFHYENMPMQHMDVFSAVKIEIFIRKNADVFIIFAQNIDCGYT